MDEVPVIFAGKVVTTLLFAGFAFLLINWPRVPGLGIVRSTWLPGLCSGVFSVGIWLVYAGLILGVFTTSYYVLKSIRLLHETKERQTKQTV